MYHNEEKVNKVKYKNIPQKDLFDESRTHQNNYYNPSMNLNQSSNQMYPIKQNPNSHEIDLQNNNLQLKVNNINLIAENKALKEIIKKINHEKDENPKNKEVNNFKLKIENLVNEVENRENLINVFFIIFRI